MAFLDPFLNLLIRILEVVKWIVIVWVVISWLLFFASHSSFRWRNRGAYHVLEQLNDICSRFARPFVGPIQRLMRRFNTAGIDWSPLIVLLLVYFLEEMLGVARNAILLR
jgi:uncharacterized protein YggT (Ycf19 family)